MNKKKGSKKGALIRINYQWCKGCGICVEFCPAKVLEMDQERRVAIRWADECNLCRLCELRCPDFAISVLNEKGNANYKN